MGSAITVLNKPVDNVSPHDGDCSSDNSSEDSQNSFADQSMADGQPSSDLENNGAGVNDGENGDGDIGFDRENDNENVGRNGDIELANDNDNVENNDADVDEAGAGAAAVAGAVAEAAAGEEAGVRCENNAAEVPEAIKDQELIDLSPSPSTSVLWWQAFKDLVTHPVKKTGNANIRVNPIKVSKALKDKVKAKAKAQPKRLGSRSHGPPI